MIRPAPAPLSAFLPTSAEEMRTRGWDAARRRLRDAATPTSTTPPSRRRSSAAGSRPHGFRVAILAQPDWRSADAWRALGRPRLFYAVSAGNMDSMINHYTANRKRRNARRLLAGRARSACARTGPTAVYAQRCREAFQGVPVVIGRRRGLAAPHRALRLLVATRCGRRSS